MAKLIRNDNGAYDLQCSCHRIVLWDITLAEGQRFKYRCDRCKAVGVLTYKNRRATFRTDKNN